MSDENEVEDDEDDTEGDLGDVIENLTDELTDLKGEIQHVEDKIDRSRIILDEHSKQLSTIEKQLVQCSNEAFERAFEMVSQVSSILNGEALFELEDELDREAATYLESKDRGVFVGSKRFRVLGPKIENGRLAEVNDLDNIRDPKDGARE